MHAVAKHTVHAFIHIHKFEKFAPSNTSIHTNASVKGARGNASNASETVRNKDVRT